MVIADISGSVASFARFTLHLVHAISSQFSKVRSFVFIDGIDEVSRFFEGVDDPTEAVHRINTEADVIWVDGHSDYGHAFTVFWERWGEEITPRTQRAAARATPATTTTPPRPGWSRSCQARARHVYWLNPEPRAYWDSGDSIVGEYAVHCDDVVECRTLRQLEQFVGRAGVTDGAGGFDGLAGAGGRPGRPRRRRRSPAGHPHRGAGRRPGPPGWCWSATGRRCATCRGCAGAGSAARG